MSFNRKRYMRAYQQSPEYKAKARAYQQSPEYKAKTRAYQQRTSKKEIELSMIKHQIIYRERGLRLLRNRFKRLRVKHLHLKRWGI